MPGNPRAGALYPAYLNLSKKKVVLVGGGRIAARKARALVDTGAKVSVISPKVVASLARLAREGKVRLRAGIYRPSDLRATWLAIAATDDPSVNAAVAADALRAGIFCNVVDQPDLCGFQAPAVVRRGLLQIAISTGGASPALAAQIRRRLEKEFGPQYARQVKKLQEQRSHVKLHEPSPDVRRSMLRNAVKTI